MGCLDFVTFSTANLFLIFAFMIRDNLLPDKQDGVTGFSLPPNGNSKLNNPKRVLIALLEYNGHTSNPVPIILQVDSLSLL